MTRIILITSVLLNVFLIALAAIKFNSAEFLLATDVVKLADPINGTAISHLQKGDAAFIAYCSSNKHYVDVYVMTSLGKVGRVENPDFKILRVRRSLISLAWLKDCGL